LRNISYASARSGIASARSNRIASKAESARAGSGAIQKSPSNVSQYKHSRVATIGAAASAGRY
jgi:hypothetical protein